MISSLDSTLMRELSGFISSRMGLSFSEERWPDLAKNLEMAAPEMGFENGDSFARWLLCNEMTVREIETLEATSPSGKLISFVIRPASNCWRMKFCPD